VKYVKLFVRLLFAIATLPGRLVFVLVALGGLVEGWACDRSEHIKESRRLLARQFTLND